MANPRKPKGVADEAETKRASYGNYGSASSDSPSSESRVREPGLSNRESWQGENQVPRAPGRPLVRQWATPSYDPQTGIGARVKDDRFAGSTRHDTPTSWDQVPDAGDSTTRHTNNTKGRSRPGRW